MMCGFCNRMVCGLAAVLLLGLGSVGAAHADVCRVTDSGSSSANGSNWTTQAMTLQAALVSSASCTEIWVEQGVYVPGSSRAATFTVPAGKRVYGGFAGGEDTRDARNPATNVTILSGDIGHDDASVNGINLTAAAIRGDNSYHVVSMTGGGLGHITASTVLDGFTITGGDDNRAAPYGTGGGLYCNGSYSGVCSPTLAHLAFRGNHAGRGGALFNDGYDGTSSPVIDEVAFSGNAADTLGGAIVNYSPGGGTSSPKISNATFANNSAGSTGGAIFNQGYQGTASPTLTNVTFAGNSAGSGGAMENYAQDGVSNPTLTNVTFNGNSATFGAAMYSIGTANGTANPKLTDVIMWGDTGSVEMGGTSTAPVIDHSIVQGGCPGAATCTNPIAGDPLLGPLQDNGGTTFTLLPGVGSAAVDAGSCATAIDQRGVTRPQGFGCDVGAVEVASPVCFVNAAATGADTGVTWADAYTGLQTALNNLACTEIWVAKGVYTPGSARTDSFNIRSGVAVYGGFVGSETSIGQRRIGALGALTTLSGDIGARGDASDNSYHVVYMDGTTGVPITTTTVLDGFTISDGNANAANDPDNAGGGLFCNGEGAGHACSPSLRNLVFSHDHAGVVGGAIYDRARIGGVSSPSLLDVGFSDNTAGYFGGAMYNDGTVGTSSPTLVNVTFNDNAALGGGAIFAAGMNGGTSSPSLVNVTFSGNAASNGGAMYNAGLSGTASPSLTNVTFRGNRATTSGGAMYNDGLNGASKPVLTDVVLWDDSGSEIYNTSATPSIDHGIVQGGCPGGATCTNLIAGDPLLGPLQDNGGVSKTMQPAMGSAAIDAGTCAVATDQRGVARPQPTGGGCDLGAVEVVGRLCFVDQAGGGAADGSSWQNAFTNLQSALTDATCTEIWVAAGVYKPGTTITDSFDIHPGVAVYGGFAGGETHRSARDPAAYLTVLSGDVDANDTNADGNATDETTVDIQGNNSYHVLTMDGTGATPITANTVLDGFTITGGNATGAYPQSLAGGLYCRGIGLGNQCSPTLANLVFIGNAATGGGGALYTGGRYAGASKPELTNIVFSANQAGEAGGAMYADGYSGTASPTLVNVSFAGNGAGTHGGALFLNGAAGGRSFAALSGVTFADNSAAGNGGAMYADGHAGGVCNPALVNVTITGNSAMQGGALFNNGDSGQSSPALSNVTLSGNSASTQGGGLFNDTYDNGISSPQLTNVIAWGDSAPTGAEMFNFPNDDGTLPAINYSIVQGGDGGIVNSDHSAATAFSAGTGNLDADPMLGALGAHGGFTPTLLPGVTGSAIDSGTGNDAPITDQRGIARPQGNGVDIGAVELQLPQDDRIFADGFDDSAP